MEINNKRVRRTTFAMPQTLGSPETSVNEERS